MHARILAYLIIFLILISFKTSGKDNCTRTYLDSCTVIRDSSFIRAIDTTGLESLTVEARASLHGMKEGRGMSQDYWGLSLTSTTDTLTVALTFGNTDFGDMFDRRIARIKISLNGQILHDGEADGFKTTGGGYNTLSAVLNDRELSVEGGGSDSRHIVSTTLPGTFDPTQVAVWSKGKLSVTVFSAETCISPEQAYATGYTREQLDSKFRASKDPAEGYWTYFDRSNDPARAHIGGRYMLAIVRRDDSPKPDIGSFIPTEYDIVYLDGAKTLADKWQPMMLKGSLRSTIFEGHYDLTWVDSTFEQITEDIHATIDNGALLTLSFPLFHTSFRMSKVPFR